jgi:hypothetical protein
MTSRPPDRAALVLDKARAAAQTGTFELTQHAKRDSMPERNVKVLDVRHALMNATRATQQPNGTWRIYGTDLDDDELIVVVDDAVEVAVRVVTVM